VRRTVTVGNFELPEASIGATIGCFNLKELSMAKSLPYTRNWHAWQNLQPPGPPSLHVMGEVETSNTNQTPHLKEAVPQGIIPEMLLLDLTITTSGIGNPVMGWKLVTFTKKISKDQYSGVDIHSDGQHVATIKVETVV
jgi:hypothetical protein